MKPTPISSAPPRLSLAANNTHYTGDWGHGALTLASSRLWLYTSQECDVSYHFCAQFQTISDLRWDEASAIIPREWLLGKEAIWVEALRCWESRPKEMSLSRRENSHHQAQNRCRVPGNRLMMVFRNKSLSWTSNYTQKQASQTSWNNITDLKW